MVPKTGIHESVTMTKADKRGSVRLLSTFIHFAVVPRLIVPPEDR
jgi:hypothetical protein